MTADGTAVEVRGVSKTYRIYHRRETTLKEAVLRRRRGVYEEFTALRDVTFSVPSGQALGILGRNGSGKSTLLKLLARIIEPDRGTVRARGRVAALLEVGAGFQPEYSAIENIFLSGAVYGVPRAELARRVDEILAFADLERFADNPVRTYSSGMYARLGFSIAVNVDPDVLLIDEVLAVGDAAFQARSLERMLEFRDAGKTLVLVTHDLGAVESFCDRALWIDAGRIRDDDLPHHVVRSYVAAVNEGEERRSIAALQRRGAAVDDHRPARDDLPLILRSMAFTGADGREREVFENGEPMTVRVEYEAREPIPTPICELTVERHDGVCVAVSSTRTGELDVGMVPAGTGWFVWEVDDLRLTPGTYYFTPRLYEGSGVHVFDEHVKWFRIRVHAGRYRERHGVAVLPSRWSHAPLQAVGDRPEMEVVPSD